MQKLLLITLTLIFFTGIASVIFKVDIEGCLYKKETKPNNYKVGKKLLPEATWINGSVFDRQLIESLPYFDMAISNPPFGKIKTGIGENKKITLKYKGSEFEFMAIEIASIIASRGVFILPQASTPFIYSGSQWL